jgi:hypothetical protein
MCYGKNTLPLMGGEGGEEKEVKVEWIEGDMDE